MGSIGVEATPDQKAACDGVAIPRQNCNGSSLSRRQIAQFDALETESGANRSLCRDTMLDKPAISTPIAIVGMAARLPGGIRSPEELWDVLLNQKDISCEVPKDRYNINAFYHETHTRMVKTRRGFFLSDDLADTDEAMFGGMKAESSQMDPQQKLLLEVVAECMENAGQVGWKGQDIGCYVGTFGDDWLEMSLRDTIAMERLHIFSANDFALSNRISYHYDLRGPSMTIKTGCSASMIGLHEACQSVASGESSSAIVAGSSLIMTPTMTACMSENMVLSPDGLCKTFDAAANGFARGEAVNALFIKRLDHALRDGDPVRAVIRSTITNGDGRTRKLAIPSAEAQESLIRKAYQRAGIDNPSRTGLFECHGTGTAAGDVAETEAIAKVFGDEGIMIGAVKPNVGHSEGASALTSIIKAVLSLEKRAIAPNAHFKTPNPKIPFEVAKLQVPTNLMPWPSGRDERVSVNSFGIGGANAHTILESARSYKASVDEHTRPHELGLPKLLVLSAMSEASLQRQIESLEHHCQSHKVSSADLAHTLGARREHKRNRAFTVVGNTEALSSELTKFSCARASSQPPDELVFVFTGQGSQWHGMGKELISQCESFRTDIRHLDQILRTIPNPPSWTLEEKISKVDDTSSSLKAEFAQPLCTAIQIALIHLLDSWGVRPTAVIGHSSGEVAAAYAAKAITAETAIINAYYRGQATKLYAKPGGMLAIGMGMKQMEKFMKDGISIACENSPQSVVISGTDEVISHTLESIKQQHPDTFTSSLDVEAPYHSHHMVDVGDAFEKMVQSLTKSSPPAIPIYSTVLGRAIDDSDHLDGAYWRANLESTVRFSAGVSAALSAMTSKSVCFVEIGPHCPLASPLRQIFRYEKLKLPPIYVSTLQKKQDQAWNMIQTAGKLFLSGVKVSLENVNGRANVLTDLPPYPWDYSAKIWHENRISKGFRQREYPHHEILGSRTLESNDMEPCWRNIIRFENSPWLSHHKISGYIVFPGAGYIAMIGEAVRQLTGAPGYSIRNLFIRNALFLDLENEVELMTSLRHTRLTDVLDSEWYDFTIYSYNGNEWKKHCEGQATAFKETEPRVVRSSSLIRPVNSAAWYRCLKRVGLEFGPHFQGLHNMSADPIHRIATADITSRADLGKGDSYAIHPTLIDKSLQLLSVSATNGMSRYLDRIGIPVSIENISILHCDNRDLCARATCRSTEHGAYAGDSIVVDNDQVVLSIRGVRCFSMEADFVAESFNSQDWSARFDWTPNLDLRPSIEDLLLDPAPQMEREYRLLDQCITLILMETYELVKDVSPKRHHMVKYKGWLESKIEAFRHGEYHIVPESQKWMEMPLKQRRSILSSLKQELQTAQPQIIFLGQFSQRILDNGVALLEDTVSPLEALMEENSLADFYDYLVHAEQYKPFLSSLGLSKKGLRVLEIGAGTGSMTAAVLDSLKTPEGCWAYSQYVFTDLSAAFFAPAKERFKEYPNLTFRPLDICVDPIDQGYQPESFDLIICSNVLHVTPLLQRSLQNVRKLLAPRGYLFLQEICPEVLFVDAVMGLLPGWWNGEDEGRHIKPYVTPDRWNVELKNAGFTGIESSAYDNKWPYHFNANMISRYLPLGTAMHVDMLYRGSISEHGREIEHLLIQNGHTVDWFTLNDLSLQPRNHVISLLEIDAPFFTDIDEATFASFRQFITDSTPTTLVWITKHVQRSCEDPRWSPVLGLARTIRLEHSFPFVTVEMDTSHPESLDALVRIWEQFQLSVDTDSEPDLEYDIREGTVYTCRIHAVSPQATENTNEFLNLPKKLEIGTSGLISSLRWKQYEIREPGFGELEVAVKYVSLNFRDVMNAMGFVGHKGELGFEGTGVITRVGPGPHHAEFNVGDQICMIGTSLFCTTLVVQSNACFKMPQGISLEDAATVPGVYSTVVYSLMTACRIQRGQSILIHSACGGVGLAAIQLCQALGVVIYVTVGNDEKVRHLMENHGIPRNRIFHSRTPAFKEAILCETKGLGVDVVLNSLSGECLHASWECVAEYGTMIEIGKRDLIGHGQLSMDLFEANRSFVGIDIHRLGIQRPQIFERTLQQVFQLIEEGKIQPIQPKTLFDAENIESAFRHMQSGRHIGKLVVRMPEDPITLPTSMNRRPISFSSGLLYLLVGGVGGLGIAITRWMVENGARNFVFLSRSAGISPASKALVRELEAMGCSACAIPGSAANPDDIQRALGSIIKPLGGVIQLAMVLKDQMFAKMTHEDWTTVQSPKVSGTWALYQALQHRSLDFFVVVGSLIGLCANIGQANYAAANCYVEAFANYAQSKGFPASVINLGGVEDVGYVSENPDLLRRSRTNGIKLITELELLSAVQIAIEQARAVKVSGQTDIGRHSITIGLQPLPSEVSRTTYQSDPRFSLFSTGVIQAHSSCPSDMDGINKFIADVESDPSILNQPSSLQLVTEEIGRLVYVNAGEDISATAVAATPIDSLMTIEIRTWLRKRLGIDIPTVQITKAGNIGGLGVLVIEGMRAKYVLKPT